jgi:hypothetical protein
MSASSSSSAWIQGDVCSIDSDNEDATTSETGSKRSASPRAEKMKVEKVKCLAVDCNRLGMADCMHKFCSKCCRKHTELTGEICEVHQERQENARRAAANKELYLQSGVTKQNQMRIRKKFNFVHPESTFEEYGQTVVVWCLSDFLRFGSHSSDTVAHLEKKQRLMTKALARGHAIEDKSMSAVKLKRSYLKKRYLALKAKWDKAHLKATDHILTKLSNRK